MSKILLLCLVSALSLINGQAPAPSYISHRPLNHYLPIIAKRALPSELRGNDKKEWQSITQLLKTEPLAAGENDLDMQLDDLEHKYLKEPTEASFAEASSTFTTSAPSLANSEIESQLSNKLAQLADILPKQEMRLKQLKQKLFASQQPAATPAATPAAATPATIKKKEKKSKGAKKSKEFTKDFKKETQQKELAQDAVSTLALIDKRVNSLTRLVSRLHQQLGVQQGKKLSPQQRVEQAIKGHKKEVKEQKSALEQMKISNSLKPGASFLESDADAEADQETEIDSSLEQYMENGGEAEQEGEQEGEQESEAELQADAEAVDEIFSGIF